MMVEAVGHFDALVEKIDPFHFTREKVHAAQHPANGVDDGGEVKVARGYLVQHRGEEKEILPIYEGHLELQGSIETRETTAENQDLLALIFAHPSLPLDRSPRSGSARKIA